VLRLQLWHILLPHLPPDTKHLPFDLVRRTSCAFGAQTCDAIHRMAMSKI
jgi:hypothetical protein